MAEVNITTSTGSNHRVAQGARVAIRNSSGIPYVIVEGCSNGSIEVWKGNGTAPTSFTEKDTTNKPSTSECGSASAAIDSSDVIHIAYQYYNDKTSELRYITFGTSTDQFGTDTHVVPDIRDNPGAITNLQTSIAVDSNDVHFFENNASDTAYNKYDGSWSIDGSVLETDSYVYVKAKWAFWADNDSGEGVAGFRDADSGNPDTIGTSISEDIKGAGVKKSNKN